MKVLFGYSNSSDSSKMKAFVSSDYSSVFYLSSYDKSIKYKYSYSTEINSGIKLFINKQKRSTINLAIGYGYVWLNRNDGDIQSSGLEKVNPDGPYRYVGLRYSYFVGAIDFEKKLSQKINCEVGVSYRYYFLKQKVGDYEHETLYYSKYGITALAYDQIDYSKNFDFFTFFVNGSINYRYNKSWEFGTRIYFQIYEPFDSAIMEREINADQWRNNSVSSLTISNHPLAIVSLRLRYVFR